MAAAHHALTVARDLGAKLPATPKDLHRFQDCLCVLVDRVRTLRPGGVLAVPGGWLLPGATFREPEDGASGPGGNPNGELELVGERHCVLYVLHRHAAGGGSHCSFAVVNKGSNAEGDGTRYHASCV